MKRIISLMTAVLLTVSICTITVSAEKYGNGKNSDGSVSVDTSSTKKADKTSEDAETVQTTDAAQTEVEGTSIDELREQLAENHKDKAKRKELVKQIVDLRRQNNDSSIPVFVKGKEVKFDVPPVIKNNRTLIPVRAVTNALGATVEWDGETNTATITKAVYGDVYDGDKTVIVINLDSGIVTVNGDEVTLDVPPQIENNRTFVPLRFIAETFKQIVEWDEETGSVTIEDADSEEDEEAAPGTQTGSGGTTTTQQQTTQQTTQGS